MRTAIPDLIAQLETQVATLREKSKIKGKGFQTRKSDYNEALAALNMAKEVYKLSQNLKIGETEFGFTTPYEETDLNTTECRICTVTVAFSKAGLNVEPRVELHLCADHSYEELESTVDELQSQVDELEAEVEVKDGINYAMAHKVWLENENWQNDPIIRAFVKANL